VVQLRATKEIHRFPSERSAPRGEIESDIFGRMFTRRTLFILGAGASYEAGLPIGVDLAKVIREKMDVRFEHGNRPIGSGDHDLYAQIADMHRRDEDAFWHAGRRIEAGLGFAQSIDDFLDQHRSDRYVNLYGKAAIVRSVLEAEARSKLFFQPHVKHDAFDPNKFADTWFAKFMYMLGRGVSRENVSSIFDNARFIIFNYDRCVEHFLFNALKRLYNLSDEETSSIVEEIQIIHPYGVVGSLHNVPFGTSQTNYVARAQGIKTYTEQIAAADVIAQLADEVYQAACLVFLGFAYHSQNMQMLKPQKRINANAVFGTAYKMSDSDANIVTHQLVNFLPTNVRVQQRSQMIRLENKLTCAALFDYYAKSLSGD
jgi:hypothetical protein